MSDMIDDNRFVLIKKYKQKLIEGTNISDSPEDMAAINSILFRFWQMGWLDKLEEEPHWIPVTERLPEKFDYYLVSDINSVWFARYESGRFLGILSGHALDTVIAWMPLPEFYKEVTE